MFKFRLRVIQIFIVQAKQEAVMVEVTVATEEDMKMIMDMVEVVTAEDMGMELFQWTRFQF